MADLLHDEPRFRGAIEAARGNITRAAKELGITKPYAMVLVKRFALNEWAQSLRVKNGMPKTGNPHCPFPARRKNAPAEPQTADQVADQTLQN